MPKRFTLAEAESLLPGVGALLADAVRLKSEYQEAEQRLQSISNRIMLLGGAVVDRDAAREVRLRQDRAAASLKTAVEEIQQTGCILKDLDTGLVDFPSRFRGRVVYLCWKLGEPSIAFWHGVEEGFAGRKPIDRDFLENHEGGEEED